MHFPSNGFILIHYYFHVSELMKCDCHLAAHYSTKRHTEIEEFVAVRQQSVKRDMGPYSSS